MVVYKKTRSRRENPRFDYKAFTTHRQAYLVLLAQYFASPRSRLIKEELLSLVSPYSDAFSLLKHSTPLYVDVLANSFLTNVSQDLGLELGDPKDAQRLARHILGVGTQVDTAIYVDWVVEQTIHLYGLVKTTTDFSNQLNKLVAAYNRQTPSSPFRFVFEASITNPIAFKTDLTRALLTDLKRRTQKTRVLFYYEMKYSRNPIIIETKLGFLSLLVIYFLAKHLDESTSLDRLSPFLTVKQADPTSAANIQKLEDVAHPLRYLLTIERTPFWFSASTERIDFFDVGVHYTEALFQEGVTPSNLKTKLVDYTQAPVSTFHRPFPTTTRAESKKALIHCWRLSYLKDHPLGKQTTYGGNLIFVFTNALLTFFKVTDGDTQSACLLQDVIETIPFYVEKNRQEPKKSVAYFGLSVDGTTPLFDVDFRSWEPTTMQVGYFVYLALCEYLASPEYRIEHTINQTINPQNR